MKSLIVLCLLTVVQLGTCSPIENSTDEIVYDQRQNGSENLRIHMNDVTLVVAPSDGILQLMSASASDFLNANSEAVGASSKPSLGSHAYSSDCGSDPVAKCKQQPHKNQNYVHTETPD